MPTENAPHKEQMELISLLPLIREVTQKGGTFRLYPTGKSMLPTIQEGTDSVLLTAPDHVKKGDAVLYRRVNGQFVLHRIVKIEKESDVMTMRGDNQYYNEPGIQPEQLIAKVAAIYRGEKKVDCSSLSHRAYLFSRTATYPVRRAFLAVKRRAARLLKRK